MVEVGREGLQNLENCHAQCTDVGGLSNFSLPFDLEYDDSSNRIGAILVPRGKPIAFTGRLISRCVKGLSTYEKELMTIVEAVRK